MLPLSVCLLSEGDSASLSLELVLSGIAVGSSVAPAVEPKRRTTVKLETTSKVAKGKRAQLNLHQLGKNWLHLSEISLSELDIGSKLFYAQSTIILAFSAKITGTVITEKLNP